MDDETPNTVMPVRSGRRRRTARWIAILIVALLAGLWLARMPIATRFVDRTLAARGVPARYAIADLGFGRQRLTDVVLGDPANPDLVADWIETRTDIGLNGPRLTGVRAGRVRVRGRLIDGKLSLGAIDRLLPAASGQPFALPRIDLHVADGRMRLTTPYGLVGVKLSGSGWLDAGFRGTLTAVGPTIAARGCRATQASAILAIRTMTTGTRIEGPVRSNAVVCGGTHATAAVARIDATLSPALDHWSGSARVAVDRIADPRGSLAELAGTVGFDGSRDGTAGPVTLTARRFATSLASGETLAIEGSWRTGATSAFAGRVRAGKVALEPGTSERLAAYATAADGSPVAPLVRQAATALAQATRGFDVAADVALSGAPFALSVSRASLIAANGVRGTLDGVSLAADGLRLNGTLRVQGGGLPTARIALQRRDPRGPVTGLASIAPYAVGDARLEATPIRFTAAPSGTTRIVTNATLSGPVAGGRIDALTLPIDALLDRRGGLTLNPGCTPVSFARLAVSGLTLDPARLTLCAVGKGGLVRIVDGTVDGGATIAAPSLVGTLGGSRLALAATRATLGLARRDFTIDGLRTRIGSEPRATRIDAVRLTGALGSVGVFGRFAGASGQVGAVPLLLSDADGDWRMANGRLTVDGAVTVADAAGDPRFRPLEMRHVTLALAGGTIDARGGLVEPTGGRRIADVTLTHRLPTGTGSAKLVVPGITFGAGFQPDQLSRIPFGVIADVRGTVTGDATIGWSPQGVTSTGVFSTANTDLAAAFGPVTGISGRIVFTDLLNLESAPGQTLSVASINPGIPVTDGTIVYRTLPGNRVRVDSGRWPFAGGTLTLEPTLLDFSATTDRRMTFRVDAMDAGQFLQQFDFDNLDATGIFDGALPMVFDATGGRIERGTLVVREGGGTIAYAGDLTQEDLGFWGNLAFQSLKSMRYRSLSIAMNGPLAGEMVTDVRFAGVSQGSGAKSNFLIRRLQRLPFVFNVKIRAPFRGLIDSTRSFYDPARLIERNLPALIEARDRQLAPVQPSESPPVRSPLKD